MANNLRSKINEVKECLNEILDDYDNVKKFTDLLQDTLNNGGKIIVCGNGGSAADSLHFVAELVGRFKKDRKALGALSLCSDVAVLTAIANDYGYEQVFARQVDALADDRDLLLVLSTSGLSINITNALLAAKEIGARTLGLLGKSGGDSLTLCDHSILVASQDTASIQEVHQILLHHVCDVLESGIID